MCRSCRANRDRRRVGCSLRLCTSPPEITAALRRRFPPLCRPKSAPEKRIKALVGELKLVDDPAVRPLASEREAKLKRLRDYVARNIRSAGPGLNQLPWSCFSSPETTLASCYGNSADRAILLGGDPESRRNRKPVWWP